MTKLAKQSFALAFIAIALILAIVGFTFADHSLAWFASNDKVDAGGISFSTQISPNLVIGKSREEVLSGAVNFSVDFGNTSRPNMIAVTRDEKVPDTFLKYLTNHYAVDNATGNAKDGMALEFAPVLANDTEAYFIDYTVYIASAFYSLPVSSLSARISSPTAVDPDHPYFNAISIDFYLEEVSADGYRGTTSLAGCLIDASKASVEFFPDGTTIPLNTEGQIKIIMRCYFDGALQNEKTNTAYVNSNEVKADDVLITVAFTAIDAEQAAE